MNATRQAPWLPLLFAAGVPLAITVASADAASAPPEPVAASAASPGATPASAGASAAVAGAKANDETQLETVTITAERTQSNLQRTADSVSVRRGDELESQGKYSLAQMLEDVAGVSGGAGTSGGSTNFASGTDASSAGLTIRGIPSNRGTGGSITSVAPAAAIYVDGVYQGIGGNDVDRVEILRGPQGTLYGRSATSGVVAIHTIDPDLSLTEGNAAVEAGSYKLRRYSGAVNIAMSEKLAVRVSANHIEQDGYYSAKGGASSSDVGRMKLLFKPTPDVSLLVGYAAESNSTHTGGETITLATPNTYLFTPTQIGGGHNRSTQAWAQLDWNLGLATLTYLPALRTWTSNAVGYVSAPGLPSTAQTMDTPKDRFNTHEVRLASPKGSKFDWQLGALLYRNTLSDVNEVDFQPPVGGLIFRSVTRGKNTDATGVYGQLTYPIADTWRLTLGGRYDITKVAVEQDYTSITGVTQSLTGNDGKRNFSNTTYKVRAEHDLSASQLVYAMVSTGFSPGDISVSTGASGNPIALALNAETLTAFEVGSKNRFLGNRLELNGSLFYYDYAGFQTQGVNITPGLQTATFATLVAPATVWGGELEMQYKLTAEDRLGGDISYSNAQFRDRSSTLVPTGAGTNVTFADFFAESKIPGVIPFRLNSSYTHTFHFENGSSISITPSARYMSAYHSSALTPGQITAGQTAYSAVGSQWVGDLSLNWLSADHVFSISGYVRNLGDNRYKTSVAVDNGASTVTPYDPRTFGLVFRADL